MHNLRHEYFCVCILCPSATVLPCVCQLLWYDVRERPAVTATTMTATKKRKAAWMSTESSSTRSWLPALSVTICPFNCFVSVASPTATAPAATASELTMCRSAASLACLLAESRSSIRNLDLCNSLLGADSVSCDKRATVVPDNVLLSSLACSQTSPHRPASENGSHCSQASVHDRHKTVSDD